MLARDNPFATDRVERLLEFRPVWSGTTWETLDEKWESLGRRATITGRHGAGKTCFLNAWITRFTRATNCQPLLLFLNREQPSISDAQWETLSHSQGKTIVLDGEEQLSLRARIRFYRLTQNTAGILVTRHSVGKLPTLVHFDPDMDVLIQCIKKLAPDHFDQLNPLLPTFWKKHKGNIRHILLECYDQVASEPALPNQF